MGFVIEDIRGGRQPVENLYLCYRPESRPELQRFDNSPADGCITVIEAGGARHFYELSLHHSSSFRAGVRLWRASSSEEAAEFQAEGCRRHVVLGALFGIVGLFFFAGARLAKGWSGRLGNVGAGLGCLGLTALTFYLAERRMNAVIDHVVIPLNLAASP